MDTQDIYEGTPFQGGVPIPGVPTSAEEGASESEEEVDIDQLRQALKGVVPQQAAAATPAAPSRLSFHLPNREDTLGTEAEPTRSPIHSPPEQNDASEQEAEQSFSTDPEDPVDQAVIPNADAALAAYELLKGAVPLTQDGSALHASIVSAVAFHEAWQKTLAQPKKQVKKTKVKKTKKALAPAAATVTASVDSAITEALIRHLKTTLISDDEDEAGATPDEIAKKHITSNSDRA